MCNTTYISCPVQILFHYGGHINESNKASQSKYTKGMDGIFNVCYCVLYDINKSKRYVIVTSTDFESKDEPTQMTKRSFTIIYFITYKKTIHFKLICKNVHS